MLEDQQFVAGEEWRSPHVLPIEFLGIYIILFQGQVRPLFPRVLLDQSVEVFTMSLDCTKRCMCSDVSRVGTSRSVRAHNVQHHELMHY
jgi:hypothetical protein